MQILSIACFYTLKLHHDSPEDAFLQDLASLSFFRFLITKARLDLFPTPPQ